MFGLGIGSQLGLPTSRAESNNNNQNGANQNKSSQNGKACFVQKYLTNCKSFYSCIYCRTHLANHDELVSRSFQGNRSRAYLFNSVINISCGPSVQRALNTGAHAVADIYCTNCGTTMGWKYEKAYVESQKYKEGKYIIELAHVVRENRHLELDKRDMLLNSQQQQQQQQQLIAHSPPSLAHESPHSSSPPAFDLNGNNNNNNNSNQYRWSTGSSFSYTSSSPPSPHGDPGNNVIINDCTVKSDSGDNDDEDELMLPFYDDLARVNRLSCPSFSSSLLHNNKLRRSFYLDSTPYDWKYSDSSGPSVSHPKTSFQSIQAAAGSLASSGSSPLSGISSPSSYPSPSSSSSTSPSSSAASSSFSPPSKGGVGGARLGRPSNEQGASSAHLLPLPGPSSSPDPVLSCTRNNCDEDAHLTSRRPVNRRHSGEETQFKFDAELDDDEHEGESEDGRRCEDSTGPPASSGFHSHQSPTSSHQLERGIKVRDSASFELTGSISLDDEEFYDCCTDHDVSNSNSNSNSTSKLQS